MFFIADSLYLSSTFDLRNNGHQLLRCSHPEGNELAMPATRFPMERYPMPIPQDVATISLRAATNAANTQEYRTAHAEHPPRQ
jgi:hypothetical protein